MVVSATMCRRIDRGRVRETRPYFRRLVSEQYSQRSTKLMFYMKTVSISLITTDICDVEGAMLTCSSHILASIPQRQSSQQVMEQKAEQRPSHPQSSSQSFRQTDPVLLDLPMQIRVGWTVSPWCSSDSKRAYNVDRGYAFYLLLMTFL
jgi:hypothetical protein